MKHLCPLHKDSNHLLDDMMLHENWPTIPKKNLGEATLCKGNHKPNEKINVSLAK